MLHFILYAVIIVLFVAGLLVTLTGLPGVWLVYVGVLLFVASSDFTVIGLQQLILLLLVSIAVSLIDNLIVPLGAKKYGSSNWGMVGAIGGGILGTLVFGPIGMLLGPLLGATLFEILFARKDTNKAFRAGIGATIGFLASVVLKFGAITWIVLWALGKMF